MHNDFVLVGPPADKTKAASAGGAEPTLQAIARAKAPVASERQSLTYAATSVRVLR